MKLEIRYDGTPTRDQDNTISNAYYALVAVGYEVIETTLIGAPRPRRPKK